MARVCVRMDWVDARVPVLALSAGISLLWFIGFSEISERVDHLVKSPRSRSVMWMFWCFGAIL